MESNDKPDYEVGYGKPPVASQFQKGNRANPNGRKPSTVSQWAKHWGEQNYVSASITFSKNNELKEVAFSIRNGEGPINAIVALQLIKGAAEGDLFFIREYMDRTEGKAPQTVTINKKGTTLIQPTADGGIEIVEQVEDDDDSEEEDGYEDEA